MRPQTSWRPVIRLAWRDARRHLARTIFATLLIALPIIGLIGFLGFNSSTTPHRDKALATIPVGAQALITATAVPQTAPPFAQTPEGAPGPWMDDSETVPQDAAALTARLGTGLELHEYWVSPDLIVSPELGLSAGEQRMAGEGAQELLSIDLDRMATVQLREAAPAVLPMLAPEPHEGELPRSADEVLISQELADRLQVSVGDVLGFLAGPDTGWRSMDSHTAGAMQNSERGYQVVGIAAGAGEEAWAPEGWLSTLVERAPAGISTNYVAVGDTPVTWEQAKALNELQAFAVSRHVLENYPSADQLYPVAFNAQAAMESVLGLVIAGVLGGALVLFLVTPAFAVSAEQSRRSLGLAAAAGATPRDLRRIVLAQGLVIGLLGGLIGVLLGFAAAAGVTAWAESSVRAAGNQNPAFSLAAMLAHFPWWVLPAGVLLALCLGALAALAPARQAARMSPVDAIRDRRPARTPRTGATKLGVQLVGPALIAAGVVAGWIALATPAPRFASTNDYLEHGVLPPGGAALQALVVLAIVLVIAGLGVTLRAIIGWIGTLGSRGWPVWRLALRDAADHPSRTVPAALAVLFSVVAASTLAVTTASALADFRDRGSETVRGTVAIGMNVPVSSEFDRLIVRGGVAVAATEFEGILGSGSVTSPTQASAKHFAPLMPEGESCPPYEGVHMSSAVELGAPLRCVAYQSGAAFHGGISFPSWLGSNALLMDPDTMRASGLEHADLASEALAAGGVVVGNAALVSESGTVRVAVSHEFLPEEHTADEILTLPGAFIPGMGGAIISTPETAASLGVDAVEYLGEIVYAAEPLSWNETQRVRTYLDETSSLLWVGTPDQDSAFGGINGLVPIMLFALVAIFATAVAVLLSATQSRRDATTAYAVGASRGWIMKLGVARAGVILLLGVPAGLAAGIGLGAYQVAWNRHLEASGAWLHTEFVWGLQFGVAGAVIAAGIIAALLFARPQRSFERRDLD